MNHPYKSTTHKERYFHFQIHTHPKVKAATVFARNDGTSWGYAVTFCSVKDKFEKRVGRIKARRRYFQGGGTVFANMKGFSWASIEDPTYEGDVGYLGLVDERGASWPNRSNVKPFPKRHQKFLKPYTS